MSEASTYYVTTPIYYVNAEPHVGHAYTTIAADTLTRARRLRGLDAFMLTGTDEHGQNIERIARERGIPEQQHCDEISGVFRRLWEKLDVRYDRFIRTTDEIHVRGVLKLWDRLVRAKTSDGRDVIYRGKYSGWYCPRCEEFKDEDDVRQPGNLCAIHERPCEWTEEENFFFRLSAYSEWLRERIESGAIAIAPEGRRNEVLSTIEQGLKDFSVSRARVKWGIPVPEQPDHVLYVWVDALSNYITALGYADEAPAYERYWQGAQERFHMLGKDIIRFHCLIWPTVLHAAGLPPPTRFFAQGWMTKEGKKISKTTGNVVNPAELVDRLGADAVRYFLLREAPYGQDWDFTDAAFVGRYNADLANDLGNLVSRALTMVQKYCGGKVPARHGAAAAVDSRQVLERYEALDFMGALSVVWAAIARLNQEIVAHAPWEMAKDPARKRDLDAFLYGLLEGVRSIAVLVFPVMPGGARRVFRMLGLPGADPGPSDLESAVLEPGTALGVVEPLFPRVDTARPIEKETTVSETPTPSPQADGALDERIDIAEFAKVDLRVAQVLEAEKVPGSKKLVKLQVDLGTEKRQVVAGIAESYAPESLVGKKVILVANLKPARLMGVESNGMVLAASLDGKAVLCTFDADVPVGTKVK